MLKWEPDRPVNSEFNWGRSRHAKCAVRLVGKQQGLGGGAALGWCKVPLIFLKFGEIETFWSFGATLHVLEQFSQVKLVSILATFGHSCSAV